MQWYITCGEGVFSHLSSPCLHVTEDAGEMGEAAGVVGELLGLYVAESSSDLRVLVCRVVLRVADTAEFWIVGGVLFCSLRFDNEGVERRVEVLVETGVRRPYNAGKLFLRGIRGGFCLTGGG